MMKNKLNFKDIILISILFNSVLGVVFTYIVATIYKDAHFMLLAVVSIYLFCIGYSFKKLNERIGLLLLSTTIFLFQASRSLVHMLSGSELELYFSNEDVYNCLQIIFIAILGVLCGYILNKNKSEKIETKSFMFKNTKYLLAAKFIYYISLPFIAYELMLKIILVNNNGYMAYYTSFKSPFIITKMSDLYIISFIIILALLPSIKSIKNEIIIFLIYITISLLAGQRNAFIVPIIFLIWYFAYRDTLDIDTFKFITTKNIVAIVLICILSIPLFIIVGDYRVGTNGGPIIGRILEFFEDLGSSNHVLLRTFSIESYIPQEDKIKFLFYPIENFFNSNTISQILFNTTIYKPQTVEYALNTFNYGAYHTYIADPAYYLSGGGFGSSYLAEAFIAFGKWGVFITSFMYAKYIKLISRININNWIIRSILFTSIYWIFYTPRDAALQFLIIGLNITNLISILSVIILGNIISKVSKI